MIDQCLGGKFIIGGDFNVVNSVATMQSVTLRNFVIQISCSGLLNYVVEPIMQPYLLLCCFDLKDHARTTTPTGLSLGQRFSVHLALKRTHA